MIQRIQTVYLSVCCVLCAACIWLEVADDCHPWALTAIMSISAFLVFVDIFLFRHRALQMRVCTFCIILMIGWYLVFAALAFVLGDGLVGVYRPRAWAAIPMVNAILLYLAFRAILRDELLVKSLDRLR